MLYGLEQCLKIALAETFVAFALDDFKENRPYHVFGKDLQQQTLAFTGRAVDQYMALPERLQIFSVAGQTLVHAFIICVRCGLEYHAMRQRNASTVA